jgi:hypothetical protein
MFIYAKSDAPECSSKRRSSHVFSGGFGVKKKARRETEDINARKCFQCQMADEQVRMSRTIREK